MSKIISYHFVDYDKCEIIHSERAQTANPSVQAGKQFEKNGVTYFIERIGNVGYPDFEIYIVWLKQISEL